MAPRKLTLAQMKQAVAASTAARKPARSRAELMKRLKVPKGIDGHVYNRSKPTFKDGTADVGATGIARLLLKEESTPQLVSRLRKSSFKPAATPKLKDCPFCGSSKATSGIGIFYAGVTCSVCLAHGPFIHHNSIDEANSALIRAVELWNKATK